MKRPTTFIDSNREPLSFGDDPEFARLSKCVFGNIEHESDRGSILIAQDLIDNELKELFRATAPVEMPKRKVDNLIEYPGVLSTFAAKTDIAYFAGLISKNLFDAIHILRKIRNAAAHGSDSFVLNDHRVRLVELYRKLGDFGKTKTEDVLRFLAIELFLLPFADSFMLESDSSLLHAVFKDRDEILQHIHNEPPLLEIAQNKLAKVELGIAVVLLCRLIIFARDQHFKEIPGDT